MWSAIKKCKDKLVDPQSITANYHRQNLDFSSICCHSRLEPLRSLNIERMWFKGPFLICIALLSHKIRLKMPIVGCHWTRFFVISPLLTFHFTEHAVTVENPDLLIWGTFESMIYYHVAEYRLLLCTLLCLTILTVGKQCF